MSSVTCVTEWMNKQTKPNQTTLSSSGMSHEEKSDESKDSFYEELEQVFDHFPKYRTKVLLGDFDVIFMGN